MIFEKCPFLIFSTFSGYNGKSEEHIKPLYIIDNLTIYILINLERTLLIVIVD